MDLPLYAVGIVFRDDAMSACNCITLTRAESDENAAGKAIGEFLSHHPERDVAVSHLEIERITETPDGTDGRFDYVTSTAFYMPDRPEVQFLRLHLCRAGSAQEAIGAGMAAALLTHKGAHIPSSTAANITNFIATGDDGDPDPDSMVDLTPDWAHEPPPASIEDAAARILLSYQESRRSEFPTSAFVFATLYGVASFAFDYGHAPQSARLVLFLCFMLLTSASAYVHWRRFRRPGWGVA